MVGIANSSGSITKTYAYDAFGVELSPVSSDANPFRYSGEYFDAETGDYYLRARFYNPRLGRFLTEDPARDGSNWYVYCNNNPVGYVDPSGKSMVLTAAAVTYAVRLVTGVIVTVLAAWFASPEGQQALNNGAKVIHEAVKNVGEAIDNAGESIVNSSGGGAPAPQKPNNNGPTAIKIISKIATGAALKEAAEEIIKVGSGGNGGGSDIVSWSNHGYKHFPNKNQSWKDIVESTKSGPAKYSFDIKNVEEFERTAWDSGTPVTNGKNWRVNKYEHTIGAVNGKETVYVRIENSAGTIHGHPISEHEYNKLLK